MAKSYQHDHEGYFVCETDDCGGFLPAGAVYNKPVLQNGFIPKWDGAEWKQVETHKGEEGYVDGVAFTIKTHGAYPDGWSSTPPPLTLEEVRTAKLAEINGGYSSVMSYIQAGYPPEEILSWERQATQARELLTNPEADALFVRVLASQKHISVDEMRDRILANAANWEPIAAMLTAQRQVLEETAYKAASVDDLEKIKVSYSV